MSKKKKQQEVQILDENYEILDSFVDACDEYLERMHCTLWSRAFDIYETESRHDAAVFLSTHTVGLLVQLGLLKLA